MKYKKLIQKSRTKDGYDIIPLKKCDIYHIMKWRNEQITVLRQKKKLTKKNQLFYYKTVIYPSFNQSKPEMILFSYLYEGNCIGYGGLTNIDWLSKRAEISFLVDTKRMKNTALYKQDLQTFLHIIKKISFAELKLNRLFTETYAMRSLHISILEESGFKYEGTLRQHNFINKKYVDSILHGYLKKNYV